MGKLGEIAMLMGKTAMSEKVLTAFTYSYNFLDVCGDTIMAWMHLWRACIAKPKLDELTGGDPAQIASKKDAAFYDGLVKTAQFFGSAVLPVALGKMAAIKNMSSAAVDMLDDGYAGK